MKKLVVLLALVATTPAVAADLAYKAPMPQAAAVRTYDWTGLYIGLNGGGGRAHNCWSTNGANVPVEPIWDTGAFIGISGAFNPAVNEGCNNGTGGTFGGQIGYRQQISSFVFGIEGQANWASFNGSNTSALIPADAAAFATLTNTTKVGAFGTFTGQVGFAIDNVLIYAKGGAAVTSNTHSGSLTGNICPDCTKEGFDGSFSASDHAKEIKLGGVAGVGVEWAFAQNWSLGAEYNHLFMGSQNVGLAYTGATVFGTPVTGLAGTPSRNTSISQDLDIATIRLNYKFGH